MEKSADLWDAEGCNVSRDNSRLDAAQLYATIGNFNKATELFENVALKYSSIGVIGVRSILMKAGLCRIAGGCSGTFDFKDYSAFSHGWLDRVEYKFLDQLATAIKQHDSSEAESVYQLHSASLYIDKWADSVIKKIFSNLKDSSMLSTPL